MEIISNIFENIGWGPLLTVNELYYTETMYEFYANLHEERVQKQGNITYKWVTSRVGGRDISFDDGILNTILGTPENCIRFYTKNKQYFNPNLYSEKRFEELFTKGEVLERHDDRNVNKLDAYGRLLQHMISNIIIPMWVTNLLSQTCTLFDHICIGKLYNKHIIKRIGFSRNEKGMLVRGGQEDDDKEEDERQDAMNIDKEVKPHVVLKRVVDQNTIVAKGILVSMHPIKEVSEYHLGMNCYEIHVQTALEWDELLMQPYSTMETIGNTIGTLIAWPRSLAALCYPSRWAPPDPTFKEIATIAEHDTESNAIPLWA
ncbi:hypothetical protein M9H77_08157 [Catharanthus roseus]|uniref:Uncharacterized protein n=1 Tax=Catharanthus roseus TaxID=4058 RepID=A0ACC0BX70_CATRO|nr:hypothetical protein M9H77_08157 [Catharanthus roseus]